MTRIVVVTLLLSVGCSKEKEQAPPSPTPAAPAAPAPAAPPAVPSGPPGSIKGVVEFTGTPPVMKELVRKADPVCAKTKKMDEAVVVKGGKLANVFVRISSPVAGTFEAPKTAALIEQHECMYHPRVVGVMEGQDLQVKNGDPTLHNVHTYKGTTTWFNQAQIAGTPPITKQTSGMDDVPIVTFKCDVHPWMLGYVAIAKNPFFAVTGDDGTFEIKNVPPGKYTLEAWHEKAGTKSVEVTVASGAAADANLSFASSDIK